MKSSTRYRNLLLVFLLSLSLVFSFYREIFTAPNDFLYATEGDGLTNYYTFAYYLKHGESYKSFEGMNYPYGESLIFLDAHPILALTLRKFSENVFDISNYGVGILNFLMLLSPILCALFLYLIFELFGIHSIISILASIAISSLSSQYLLWKFGHYALSYSFFFPLTWYLHLCYRRHPGKIIYSLLVAVNSTFWFYIHTYLGMIAVSFVFLSMTFNYLGNIRVKYKDLNWYLDTFLQCFLPLLIVYTGISVLDGHPGRIDMPYLAQYRADIYSVFAPNFSWTKEYLNKVFDLSTQSTLAWAQVGNYIGLSTIISLLIGILFFAKHLITRNWKKAIDLLPAQSWPYLFSALCLLLFSMAFPFRFDMAYLLPKGLQQFVSMGRFAWAFYYVSSVFGIFILSKVIKGNLGFVSLIISCLLLFSESIGNHVNIKSKIYNKGNIFNVASTKPLSSEVYKLIDFNKYQALFPLPFYHGYINLHDYKGSYKSVELAEAISFRTGIPLFSASTPRSSILESQRIAQILMPPNYFKSIQYDIQNKPILMTYTGEKLGPEESWLFSQGDFLLKYGKYWFYELDPIRIIRYRSRAHLEEFFERKDSLVKYGNADLYVMDSNYSFTSFESFDHLDCELTYRGKGALKLEKSKFNVVYKSKSNEIPIGEDFELSYWYYNTLFNQSFNRVWCEVKDANGEIMQSFEIGNLKSHKYDGDWAFQHVKFRLEEGSDHIEIYSQGADLYEDYVVFDELLIRPAYKNVYRNIHSAIVIKNNEDFPLDKAIPHSNKN